MSIRRCPIIPTVRASAQIVVLAVVSLLGLGVVMVTSASMSLDDQALTVERVLHDKNTLAFALAVLALLVGALTPIRGLMGVLERAAGDAPRRLALLILLSAGLVLLAIAVMPYLGAFSHEVNASRRWIRLPGVAFTFQPSEIVKWSLVLLMGVTLWLGREFVRKGLVGALPAIGAVAVIAAPIALEDLGTGVLIVLVAGFMLLAGGACWWKLAPLGLVGVGAGVMLVVSEPYRMERVRTFLDPFEDPQGAGYHVVQSMATIAGGGGIGRGLGMGIQKFGYLPEDQTDFVFSIINEELGLAGAGLVVFLYLALLWSGFAIARSERHPALRLIALGILTTLGAQGVINLLVVTGWAPAKGIPLPLISQGGTGWIMTAGSLGLLVSMDRSRSERAQSGVALASSAGEATNDDFERDDTSADDGNDCDEVGEGGGWDDELDEIDADAGDDEVDEVDDLIDDDGSDDPDGELVDGDMSDDDVSDDSIDDERSEEDPESDADGEDDGLSGASQRGLWDGAPERDDRR